MALVSVSYSADNAQAVQGAYRNKYDRLLTEWDTTTIPKLAGGTVIEVGGAAFLVSGDTTIGGTAPSANGDYYVTVTVAGAVAWATSKSGYTWSESNGGWYSSTTLLLPVTVTKDSTSYYKRNWLDTRNQEAAVLSDHSYSLKTVMTKIGSWDMDATATKNVSYPGGDTTIDLRMISFFVTIISDANVVTDFTAYNTALGDVNGAISFSPAAISLTRTAGGLYDFTAWDDTTINRGWITIVYSLDSLSTTP